MSEAQLPVGKVADAAANGNRRRLSSHTYGTPTPAPAPPLTPSPLMAAKRAFAALSTDEQAEFLAWARA
jgi:hypothetical protein